MKRRPDTTRTILVLGGLMAAVVVVLLPASLAFVTPSSAGMSCCAGEPSAVALRALDETLQGGALPVTSSSPLCFLGTLPIPVVQLAAPVAQHAATPIENATTLLL